MGEDLFSPLLGVAAMAGAILGIIVGWWFRPSPRAGRKGEYDRLLLSCQELNEEMAKMQAELFRKREIAALLPMIVRSLTGKLTVAAIPPIIVRFMKEFFHASQVGFFAPAKGEKPFTLIEGFGFPPNWKGKVRISPEDGILGMALSNRVVTSKEDHAEAKGQFPPGVHSLETKGVLPDFVAPVILESSILGALVLVSPQIDLRKEIVFASMMADLISNAFQHATPIEPAEQSAAIDPLTKIYSRRYFTHRFEMELRRARNYAQALAVIRFDIDHFKKVNDTYGPPAGDRILARLGQILGEEIRSFDFAARYGGEEFIVVLTQADETKSRSFAENLRAKVESKEFRIPDQEFSLQVTISGGVAIFPQDGGSTTDLIRVADEALYEAKQSGGNRIVVSHQLGLDGKSLREEA